MFAVFAPSFPYFPPFGRLATLKKTYIELKRCRFCSTAGADALKAGGEMFASVLASEQESTSRRLAEDVCNFNCSAYEWNLEG